MTIDFEYLTENLLWLKRDTAKFNEAFTDDMNADFYNEASLDLEGKFKNTITEFEYALKGVQRGSQTYSEKMEAVIDNTVLRNVVNDIKRAKVLFDLVDFVEGKELVIRVVMLLNRAFEALIDNTFFGFKYV